MKRQLRQASFYRPLWEKNKGRFYRGTSESGKGFGFGYMGDGMYLTWDRGMAQGFATISAEQHKEAWGKVETYKLPKDLKLLDAQGKTMSKIKKGLGVQPWDKIANPIFNRFLTHEVKRRGYEGVISDDIADGLVIFNPKRAKKLGGKK